MDFKHPTPYTIFAAINAALKSRLGIDAKFKGVPRPFAPIIQRRNFRFHCSEVYKLQQSKPLPIHWKNAWNASFCFTLPWNRNYRSCVRSCTLMLIENPPYDKLHSVSLGSSRPVFSLHNAYSNDSSETSQTRTNSRGSYKPGADDAVCLRVTENEGMSAGKRSHRTGRPTTHRTCSIVWELRMLAGPLFPQMTSMNPGSLDFYFLKVKLPASESIVKPSCVL